MRRFRVACKQACAYCGAMTQITQIPDTTSDTYHYRVIARAIAVIDGADQPLSLEALAAQMGMSAAHFQRVFSAWVGVSPKRYQQYLTLGHAKTLLRARFTTLEAAQEAVGATGMLTQIGVMVHSAETSDTEAAG